MTYNAQTTTNDRPYVISTASPASVPEWFIEYLLGERRWLRARLALIEQMLLAASAYRIGS